MGRQQVPDADTEPSRARRRVWAYGTVGLLAIGLAATASTVPLRSVRSETGQITQGDLGLREVADLRTALADFQVFLEPRLVQFTPASPHDIANAGVLAAAVSLKTQVVVNALSTARLEGMSNDLATAAAAFKKAASGLAPLAAGRSNTADVAIVAAARAAYTLIWDVTSTAATRLQQSRDLDMQQAVGHLDVGHETVLVVDALAVLGSLSMAITLGERARRRERRERTDARRQAIETSLQRALEMSKAEPDVYGIVERSLHESVPRLQVEMLVADSSRAHFLQTLSTGTGGPEERNGCGVVSPLECPATIRGRTLVFPSSRAIDACPFLQDRASGKCSAACIAISIGGKTVGVMHATGPDDAPPTDSEVRCVELTARRSSERIGMLRAFETSESQARVDPLTGLLNRRSLENRVHDLQREGVPYALAYGDLDHFKMLNDAHGHETGDQALRLFSRVLRDAIRPNDIAARYGGEEFVVVLPDCNTDVATGVLERVRERLALALTTGRVAAFTVSFGLALSTDADTFDDVVAVADEALLGAKAAGRNRVVVAASSDVHAPIVET